MARGPNAETCIGIRGSNATNPVSGIRCCVGAVAPRQRTIASSPSSSRRSVARWSSSSAIEIGLCPMIRMAVLPEPIPQNTRPGAMRLMVAWAAAVTAAGRDPATATPVPMPIRDVRAASSAITA